MELAFVFMGNAQRQSAKNFVESGLAKSRLGD